MSRLLSEFQYQASLVPKVLALVSISSWRPLIIGVKLQFYLNFQLDAKDTKFKNKIITYFVCTVRQL